MDSDGGEPGGLLLRRSSGTIPGPAAADAGSKVDSVCSSSAANSSSREFALSGFLPADAERNVL